MTPLRIPLSGISVVVCAAIAGLAPAHGEEPSEDIAETIAEAAQICRAVGGKPDTAAVLRGEDLNGDSHSDFTADFAKLNCDGAANPLCNENGCTLHLYFSDGEGSWDLVFEDFVKSYKFSSSGAARTMHVTTSGVPCNKPADETCAYNYRLDKDAVVPVR
ncbi:MAG: hypothetical protein ACRECX_03590 [Methyloceanibacter sp.]|uniref:hypothetical protein n=1 Tax=Methyloceanibacter sp. TaxID=1965321 RepID=UPI003D6CFCD2